MMKMKFSIILQYSPITPSDKQRRRRFIETKVDVINYVDLTPIWILKIQ
jgi:hypothetical protein